ncbi:hypothetical protein CEXT_304711 [Caerostris extrusa]|uniref:Uncharacterized protein n=1 Tax=Caerostris extrusa TaxID=172846 RepID=A0AAV4S2T5_CAEEX|nr:hypothetical protein CEXT_304711 [Caerostris extrusa]
MNLKFGLSLYGIRPETCGTGAPATGYSGSVLKKFIITIKLDSCPTGFICGCRIASECRLTEACINNQCRDPCASPTACGTNARCQTTPTPDYVLVSSRTHW